MSRFVDHMGAEEQRNLDADFARGIYASGLALSTFNTPYWKAFFSRLRPSFKVPSPYMLGGPLLNAEYATCTASNQEKIKRAAAVGVMTDSYTNTRHESVIDIVVTTPRPVLYKQIYRGVARETGEYVGNELLPVIREIGPEKVWILVTDNASNMVVAWEIVTSEFPHITAIGCASHCWNLYFQDLIEAIAVVQKYYKHARNVVRKIKNSSNILAVFQEKQKEKYGNKSITLKLPGKTRWAGAVILFNSLLKNRAALQETVITEGLDVDRTVRKTVLESRFWERVKSSCDLLTPLHAAITLIESNRALLSDVYFLQQKIDDCVSDNVGKLRLSSAEKRDVKNIIQERRKFTISPVHMAAYMLDPRFRGDGLSNEEVGEAIRCISRLAGITGIDEGSAIANLGEFRTSTGFFATESIWQSAKSLHPSVWWRGVCSTQPLCSIAASLLSMPPTAAEVERRWSDHGFIHDKLRNRLLNTRVTKLTTTRSTLVAALSEKKSLDPLSVPELNEYFDKYLSSDNAARADGRGDERERGTTESEGEDEILVSDEESEDEVTDWEMDSDSGAESSDSEQASASRSRHSRLVRSNPSPASAPSRETETDTAQPQRSTRATTSASASSTAATAVTRTSVATLASTSTRSKRKRH